MKFYKRDPDRALAGMAELTLKQRGAYNSLIDLLYSRDGDVPDDDARVARMISCHWREWKAVKSDLIAAGKIWSEGGKIHARRVQETIKEAADFSQEQRKRVSKRWQDSRKPNETNDSPIPAGNTSTPIATPTPTPTKKERPLTGSKEIPEVLVFNEFWQGHPRQRRGNKQKAIAAWKSALARASPGEIMTGHQSYLESDEVRDGYAKGAAAWLNDDRWASDYRTFRTKTPDELREEFINGDERGDLGSGAINGECVEVPRGGFEGDGGSLPRSLEGTVGRPSEGGGNGVADGVVEGGAAQTSGYLEGGERVQASIQELAAVGAKRAKPR